MELIDEETVLRVGGELDMVAAPLLGTAVLQACSESKQVVIDACGVTFVDAAGLRGLLGGYEPAVVAQLRVRDASRPLARLLEVVGMLHLVEGQAQ